MDRVNDFAFKIATANGTGSASANGLIMQAIFRMGVPVTGKNVFPSNIQGLPTWYEIRVSKQGYNARTPNFDLMVALNAATYARDVAEVHANGWLLYDSSWPLDERLKRADVTYLGIPLAEMCNASFKGVRERILMKNIAYAGALAALLGMDTQIIRTLLDEKFSAKKALMDSNQKAVDLGYNYAKEHFACPLPIRLEPMDATKDSILIDGNTSAALGCVYAGATVAAWYPITPSTSLMDGFRGFCKRFRRDPETKKNLSCIIQAEDELAAIGMVIGAAWAGARAFTSTSGPGISLMNEFIGLAYYAEVPAVIFDVQRTGPSTGMPTRTQQGDLLHVCLRVARRHAPHLPLSGGPARSVRTVGSRVRPRRSLPDAGLRAERSRHRHERLDDPEARLGRQLSPGSRQGAVGRRARDGEDVLSLSRFRWRRHHLPDLSRDASQGRVFHARLGSQPLRRLHRRRSGVHRGRRPDRPQDSGRRARRAGADRADEARRVDGHPHRRRLPRRLRRGARSADRGTASPSTTCASAGSRSATRCGGSSNSTR